MDMRFSVSKMKRFPLNIRFSLFFGDIEFLWGTRFVSKKNATKMQTKIAMRLQAISLV